MPEDALCCWCFVLLFSIDVKRIVILISGRGSNLGAIIEAKLPLQVCAVISNRPQAAGLDIARRHGIDTVALDHRAYATREDFDDALAATIDRFQPDYVVLAGFMRLLTAGFIARYPQRILNIHPSLLPSFPGLHTHAQALAAGVKIHGCTVHLVTAQLDHGPILAQAAVAVLPDDDETTLARRVLDAEHRLYPEVLRGLTTGTLQFEDNAGTTLDQSLLSLTIR